MTEFEVFFALVLFIHILFLLCSFLEKRSKMIHVHNWISKLHYRMIPIMMSLIIFGIPPEEQMDFPEEYGLKHILNQSCFMNTTFDQEKVSERDPNGSECLDARPYSEEGTLLIVFLVLGLTVVFYIIAYMREKTVSEWVFRAVKGDTVRCLIVQFNKSVRRFIILVILEILNFIVLILGSVIMYFIIMKRNLILKPKPFEVNFSSWKLKCKPSMETFDCIFSTYDASNVTQCFYAECIFPKAHSAKMFSIFIHVWVSFQAGASITLVSCRMACLYSLRCRYMWLYLKVRPSNPSYLESTVSKCTMDDWLLLNLMANNMKPDDFCAVIKDFLIGWTLTKDNGMLPIL
ncbi:hypothetical protein TNIN_436431 [Trichonephila inaurata madagascariensis]|uniref:Uncharacterized protein n=1 Tax=Trichonephila inaurata madagascariensis TaxID=2747483 RepID=A0A8X7CBW0_9ARAC|nr:hypothetical protein TNIN_436431 [Trichonephila inaurata madagascariensis]